MSYTQEPDSLTAAYRPVVFRNARTSTADVESLLVTVYVFTIQQAQFRKAYTTKSGNDYTFDIDIQSVLQRALRPTTSIKSSLFASTTAYEITGNSDVWGAYYIETDLEYRNASGFLTTSAATTETSSTLYAIPATRQQDETIALTDYYFQSTATQFDFLTNAPTALDVCRDAAFHLSFIGFGLDSAEYKFYTTTGLGKTVRIEINQFNPAQYNMATLSTGPANLEGSSGFSFTYRGTASGMPTDLDPYTYYTINLGSWNSSASSYTQYSVERRFDLVDCCEPRYRFYWMNPLGAVDQYTFARKLVRQFQHRGQVADIALPWNPAANPPSDPDDRGIIKTDIAAQVTLDIVEHVTADVAEWLHGLLISPEVYMESGGDYLAVTIEGGRVTLEDSSEGRVRFAFTALIENTFTQDI